MAIKSISDLARVHGVERRDKVALRAGDRTFTYGELNERTSRVANALRAEGVEEQDRVAFLDKNGPEYFDVLIGGAKANAVDVAVNWRLAPPEVAYIVNDWSLSGIWTGATASAYSVSSTYQGFGNVNITGSPDFAAQPAAGIA